MSDIKAIVFDCFGVLYPASYGLFYQNHHDIFENDPSAWDALNLQIDLGDITREQFFKEAERITGIPGADIQKEIDSILQPDPAIVAFIKSLTSRYTIVLLSNAGKEEIQILVRDGIDALFDATLVSYEVHLVKPDPAIFRACAVRTGIELSASVFVDDSQKNIDAANQLGMKGILYPTFGQIPAELASYAAV